MRGWLFVCVALLVGAPALADPPAPLDKVDPLVGTSTTAIGGQIDTFPGADAPFGMLQWSPDTPSQPAGGGYNYNDGTITGFSLTHLSGPGCSVGGDVSILPFVGALGPPDAPDLSKLQQPFAHASEVAQPGYYQSLVGAQPILSQLAVTTRSGLGRFTFPSSPMANIIINASSDQGGSGDTTVQLSNGDMLTGSVKTGWFCGMPDTHTVYFALQFNRKWATSGTWMLGGTNLTPNSTAAHGSGVGAWVTFDTTQNPTVEIKAAISYVSVAGAHANLRAEATTWNIDRVRSVTQSLWAQELGRISVSGGSDKDERIFYTALYHTLLHPNVFSDADGSYRGFDDQIHKTDAGHVEYANFSGWDVYRTQMPLIAMLDPIRTSDMMRSFVHTAQAWGFLPRWSLANTESGVMGGDPADPSIAGAYAFGARDFDAHAALQAMVKGATDISSPPGLGWYVERPGLDEYLTRGYVVNTHTTNVSPVPNGASLTLEYSLDDFSIAQFAKAIGDRTTYETMMRRAQNWATLFDRSTGLIAPRDADGAFQQTPVTDAGQSGFQEGNAAQYTWMVPQNYAALIGGMGGDAAAQAKLDDYFSQINAGQDKPFAWLGNEPSLGSPWAYLSAGAPYKEETVVRAALVQLYGDTPDGIPGNDDLGTMSAWYVWCALGLYPQNPAAPVLDLGTPLFPHARIAVPDGAQISIDAPQASDDAAYIEKVAVNGSPWQRSWVPFALAHPMHLAIAVGTRPNTSWAAASQDAPPSYALGPVSFPPSSSATVEFSRQEIDIAPGGSANVGVSESMPSGPRIPIAVSFTGVPGVLTVGPVAHLGPVGDTSDVTDVQVTAGARSGLYRAYATGKTDDGALLPRSSIVVRVVRPGESLRLGYIANFFGDSITPIDPNTDVTGVDIPVGLNPRDLALSPDGARVYVADNGSNDVSVVDTGSQKTIATVKVGNAPWGIRVTPDGKTVWVANSGDNTVQPIDTATLLAGAPIAVGAQPGGIAIAPNGAMLYVADQSANAITPVDTRVGKALPPIPVGAQPRTVLVSADSATIFSSDKGGNTVTIASASGTGSAAVSSLAVPVGVLPKALALSPDGKQLFVANSGGNSVTPIDLATRTALAPIVVGYEPVAIAISPDGASAFVVNLGDNDCVVVDVRTHGLSEPIPLAAWPVAIALP
ncbi:MAG TPA: GH92 family glycosyl hydrolase [Candidatus Eremiobacteraceae bacterium]|nr:GH92 family glycosyl hydrolase [Candidatus Eremiobacteraceae bacterium]